MPFLYLSWRHNTETLGDKNSQTSEKSHKTWQTSGKKTQDSDKKSEKVTN